VTGEQHSRRIHPADRYFRGKPGQCVDRRGNIVEGPRPAAARLIGSAVFGHADRIAHRRERGGQRASVGSVVCRAPEAAVK
jgi:hypothetical protein